MPPLLYCVLLALDCCEIPSLGFHPYCLGGAQLPPPHVHDDTERQRGTMVSCRYHY